MTSRALVAVVDDDCRVLESIENLLASAGYGAAVFLGGDALLADPRFMQIDCVVSDIAMPGMDGFELKRRLDALRPGLPIIFVTAREEVERPAGTTGSIDRWLLRKPFAGPLLLAAIAEALDRAGVHGDRPL